MGAWLALIPAISELLDKIIPDPLEREKAQSELLKYERAAELEKLKMALSADLNQSEINKIEATNSNIFISGWRPFIGWVCGIAFAYHFIIQPVLVFIIAGSGGKIELPSFNMEALSTVLMGMLGLSGLRTIEKIKNISK
ncbi:MAG: holin family protein [Rickettsiales bacterium]